MTEDEIRQLFHSQGDRCRIDIKRKGYTATLVMLDDQCAAIKIASDYIDGYAWRVGTWQFVCSIMQWADMGGNWREWGLLD